MIDHCVVTREASSFEGRDKGYAVYRTRVEGNTRCIIELTKTETQDQTEVNDRHTMNRNKDQSIPIHLSFDLAPSIDASQLQMMN